MMTIIVVIVILTSESSQLLCSFDIAERSPTVGRNVYFMAPLSVILYAPHKNKTLTRCAGDVKFGRTEYKKEGRVYEAIRRYKLIVWFVIWLREEKAEIRGSKQPLCRPVICQ